MIVVPRRHHLLSLEDLPVAARTRVVAALLAALDLPSLDGGAVEETRLRTAPRNALSKLV